MSREDIIRMAEEAGITNELIVSGWGEHWMDIPVQLERFATLVAAAEREVCARLCEGDAELLRVGTPPQIALMEAAAAIRARGQG